MAVSGDYPKPVTVNGFLCRNCQDVSMAKRFIDPEHPLSGRTVSVPAVIRP